MENYPPFHFPPSNNSNGFHHHENNSSGLSGLDSNTQNLTSYGPKFVSDESPSGGGDHEDYEDNGLSPNNDNKKKSSSILRKKIKKHRYAFQTRSQVDILDDGYRWRKYGQKAVKNNKHPRSYYRCTHQGCKVKKQVQRLAKDEEIVVTTYEGMHSHVTEKSNDNFEHILNQMQIFTPLLH